MPSLFLPLMGSIPARSVTRLQGIIVPASSTSALLAVNVNGNIALRILDATT